MVCRENWGLNTYRLNRLLIEEGVATVADRVSAASTLSHELVHQWFGNLVTMRWWDGEFWEIKSLVPLISILVFVISNTQICGSTKGSQVTTPTLQCKTLG